MIAAVVAVASIVASILLPPASGFIVGAVVGAAIGAAGYLLDWGLQNAAGNQTKFSLAQFAIAVVSAAVIEGISVRVRWAKAQRANQEGGAGVQAANNAPAPSAVQPPAVRPQDAARLSTSSESSLANSLIEEQRSIYTYGRQNVGSTFSRNSRESFTYDFMAIRTEGTTVFHPAFGEIPDFEHLVFDQLINRNSRIAAQGFDFTMFP